MDLNIDDLIIRPEHFVINPDKRYKVAAAEEGSKLNIFEDARGCRSCLQSVREVPQQRGEPDSRCRIAVRSGKVCKGMRAGHHGMGGVGKSQIAADYYSGY